MDLQSIANNPLHIDRYIYDYLALDTRYADEVKYGKPNEFGGSNYTTYTWYIDNKIRDVVELELYNFFMSYPINSNRKRFGVEIVEFNNEAFIHPNGNRFHFICERIKNAIQKPYWESPPNYQMRVLNNFQFRNPHTILDKISINLYDSVDRMDAPYTLTYQNVSLDFSSYNISSTGFIFLESPVIPKDTPLNPIGHINFIFSGFTTSNPVADADIISFINRQEGFPGGVYIPGSFLLLSAMPFGVGVGSLPIPAAPIGTPSTATLQMVYPNRIQFDLRVKFIDPATKSIDPKTRISVALQKKNKKLFLTKNISAISSIKHLPISDIQRMIKYPYQHVYVSLDTKNANDVFNNKIYSWNVEQGLRASFGSTSIIGALSNIVAVRLLPIYLYYNSSYLYSNNPEMLTLRIHELSDSYVGKSGNHYHFKMDKCMSADAVLHYNLVPTQNFFYLRNTFTQLTSITLELNQIQNLPDSISTTNVLQVDLLTTNLGITLLDISGTGHLRAVINDPNTLAIGDTIVISGTIAGTIAQNELINNRDGYEIINIIFGNQFILNLIPGFAITEYYMTAVLPASKTVINIEFLTL